MKNSVVYLTLKYFFEHKHKSLVIKRAIQKDFKRSLKTNAFFIILFFTTKYSESDQFAQNLYFNLLWYIPVFYILGLIREINEERMGEL